MKGMERKKGYIMYPTGTDTLKGAQDMSKRLKQLLSFALVLCMAFTMLPMGAFAAEDAEPGLAPDTPTIDGVTPIDVNAHEYIFPLRPLGEYAAIYPAFGEYKWRIPMYTAAQPEMPEEFYAMLEDPESYGMDAIAAMIENHSTGFINTLEDSLKRAGISVDQAAQGTWTSENDVLTIADGWLTANKMGMAKVKLTYMAEEAIAPPPQQETPAEPALKPPVTKPKQAAEPEPEVAPEPAPESTPEPTPEAVTEPESSSEPEPAPEVEPAPEATPDPAPEPAPEPEPEPTPEPEPEVIPEPEPTPEPEPAPEAEVIPESALADTTTPANQEVQTQMVEKTLTWDIPIYDFGTNLLANTVYERNLFDSALQYFVSNQGTHQLLYCIQHGAPITDVNYNVSSDGNWTPSSISTNKGTVSGERIKELIGLILKYGHQANYSANQSPTNTEKYKIAATQFLIWEVMGGERDANFKHIGTYKIQNEFSDKLSAYWNSIMSYYKQYESAIKNDIGNPISTENSFDFANKVYTLDWNQGAYTTTLSGNLNGWAVASGNDIARIDGNSLVISSTTPLPNGKTITLQKTTSRQELKAWLSNASQNVVAYVGDSSKPVETTISFKVKTDQQNVTLGLYKTAKIGDKQVTFRLQGAIFDLYKRGSDEPVQRGLITDEEGKISVPLTVESKDQYYFKEVSAPDGYKFDANQTYDVTKSHFANVENNGKFTVNIKKISDMTNIGEQDTASLAGAKFTLHYIDADESLGEYETDANGNIQLNYLPAGTYTLTETVPPNGYELPENPATTFTVDANGKVNGTNTNSVTITNNRQTASLIVAKDVFCNVEQSQGYEESLQPFQINIQLGNLNTPVEAEFTGTTAKTAAYNGNGLYTVQLGKDETATITGIPTGTKYTITETLGENHTGFVTNNIAVGEPNETARALQENPITKLEGNVSSVANENTYATVYNRYFKSKKTPISGKKTWGGVTDIDALVGLEIDVQLWRKAGENGTPEKIGDVKTTNQSSEWKYDFGELDEYASENIKYIYYVEETAVRTTSDVAKFQEFLDKQAGTSGKQIDKIMRQQGTHQFIVFGKAMNDKGNQEILGTIIAQGSGSSMDLTNVWTPAMDLGHCNFYVQKVDAENGETPLEGAYFELEDSRGIIQGVRTNQDGIASFNFLAGGTYTLREVTAPTGHLLNPNTWTLVIAKDKLESVSASETGWVNFWSWTPSASLNAVPEESTEPDETEIALYADDTGTVADSNTLGTLTVKDDRIKGKLSISKLLQLDNDSPDVAEHKTIAYQFDIYKLTGLDELLPLPESTPEQSETPETPGTPENPDIAEQPSTNLIIPQGMQDIAAYAVEGLEPEETEPEEKPGILDETNMQIPENAELIETVTVYADGTAIATEKELDYGSYLVVESNPRSVSVPSYTWQNVTFTNPNASGHVAVVQDGKAVQVNITENSDIPLAVTATNAYTRKEGTLSLRKVIENYAGDRDRDWTFDITLTSPQPYVKLASSYPYTVGEESYTLDLQPVNRVEENPSHTPAEAELTPEPSTEDENDADGEPSVDIGEPPIDDSMISSVMKGQIKLKHGEEAVISGLPEGTTFQITEQEANTDSYITTGTVTVSNLPEDTEDAGIAPLADMTDTVGGEAYPIDSTKDTLVTFTNSKRLGNLVITKTVERRDGAAPDAEETFGFTVNLYTDSSKQTPLAGTYDYTYTNGIGEAGTVSHGGTVTLRHGQSLTIQNLPASAHYEVEEQTPDGYTVIAAGNIGDIPVNGGTHTAAFVNRTGGNTDNGSGSLTIRKNVSGLGGELDREFTFTVALSAPGTYHYTGSHTGEIENGGTITLRHGEAITISGLPAGTTYTVTETEIPGYDVLASGDTGTILNNTVAEAVFDNANDEIPEGALTALTLSKVVTGNAGNKNQDFHFIIVLLDEKGAPLTEEYRYVGTGSADAEKVKTGSIITLKDGQTLTILDLPVGTKYSITEQEAGQNGYITSCIGAEQGIISAEPSRVTFINHKGQGVGHLSIHKTVTGDNADQNQDWDFVITLANADFPLESSYTYSGSSDSTDIPAPANGILYFTDGVGTIRLRHGQSIIIRDLPVGTTYTVTETQANADGYTTTANGANGTIADGTTAAVSFVNDRPSPGRPGGGGGGGRRPTPDTEINEPDTPRVYYPGDTPNPNEPDSPDEILIMEDDVPQSYIKTWDPENEEFVYLPEEPIPLAPMTPTPTPLARLDTTPKTNDPTQPWFWLGLCIASILGIGLLKPRKKNDEE